MCAIKPLVKFLFDAWKSNVKNVTNKHRINGGKNSDIKCSTWTGLDKYQMGLGGYREGYSKIWALCTTGGYCMNHTWENR